MTENIAISERLAKVLDELERVTQEVQQIEKKLKAA